MEMSSAKQPPRLAVLLLAFAVRRQYRDLVLGDLHEEFVRCRHNEWWYWRQALRSIPWLLAWEQSQPAMLLFVIAEWLLVGGHALWTFILSQVPLKADPAGWAILGWGIFR